MKVVGICGISGSGKSFLIEELSKLLEFEVTIISMDNYYKPLQFQEKDDKGIVNFDVPTAIYHNKIQEHIELLRNGEEVNWQTYGFNVNQSEALIMRPSKLVLIEGIFLLHIEEIKKMLDYSVLLESDRKLILEKRIARDMKSRGMTEQEVLYQWHNHVLPGYSKFIQPHEEGAKLTIFNNHIDDDMVKKVYEALQSFVIKERKD
jgi:uridine kinase